MARVIQIWIGWVPRCLDMQGSVLLHLQKNSVYRIKATNVFCVLCKFIIVILRVSLVGVS